MTRSPDVYDWGDVRPAEERIGRLAADARAAHAAGRTQELDDLRELLVEVFFDVPQSTHAGVSLVARPEFEDVPELLRLMQESGISTEGRRRNVRRRLTKFVKSKIRKGQVAGFPAHPWFTVNIDGVDTPKVGP